jgi:transposase-like protein
MIDGIHFHDRVILVALGIGSGGDRHVLGLRQGSTEANRGVRSLLSDRVDWACAASSSIPLRTYPPLEISCV